MDGEDGRQSTDVGDTASVGTASSSAPSHPVSASPLPVHAFASHAAASDASSVAPRTLYILHSHQRVEYKWPFDASAPTDFPVMPVVDSRPLSPFHAPSPPQVALSVVLKPLRGGGGAPSHAQRGGKGVSATNSNDEGIRLPATLILQPGGTGVFSFSFHFVDSRIKPTAIVNSNSTSTSTGGVQGFRSGTRYVPTPMPAQLVTVLQCAIVRGSQRHSRVMLARRRTCSCTPIEHTPVVYSDSLYLGVRGPLFLHFSLALGCFRRLSCMWCIPVTARRV